MTTIGKGALLFLGGVALRAKDSVMKTVTKVQENAGDIYAEAKQINLEREENEKPVALESEPDESVEAANENEV